MKILHFILGKANKDRATGVNQVVSGLCKYLNANTSEVRVIGLSDSVDSEGQLIERDGFQIRVYSSWNKSFRKYLNECIDWADVIHLHGTYIYSNIRIADICLKKKKPYVVTPHNGMSPFLESRKSSIKKKIFRKLFLERMLKEASLIHALTEEESTEILQQVHCKKMVCIPNGVDLQDFPFAEYKPKLSADIKIGYLGRLSSEKNIESLCDAVQEINEEGIKLIFGGPLTSYSEKIKEKYPDLNFQFIGPVYGKDKIKFFSDIDIFVIPSFAEGFSIAAAECLASGPPLLITRTSKMAFFYKTNSFYMCEPTAFSIKSNLQIMLSDRKSWETVVSNARRLVASDLNWNEISKKMIASYRDVINE